MKDVLLHDYFGKTFTASVAFWDSQWQMENPKISFVTWRVFSYSVHFHLPGLDVSFRLTLMRHLLYMYMAINTELISQMMHSTGWHLHGVVYIKYDIAVLYRNDNQMEYIPALTLLINVHQ